MTTANNARRRQTDRVIADAQARVNRYVSELPASDPNPERVTEITVTIVRDILFTTLQNAPIMDTDHAQADICLAYTLSALGFPSPSFEAAIAGFEFPGHRHLTVCAQPSLNTTLPFFPF